MINLNIDGKQVEVPEGTTVLRAAQQAGIDVPTLCDHSQLKPVGGCRLCIVDVQGFRVPMSSCTLPASNGMEEAKPAVVGESPCASSILGSHDFPDLYDRVWFDIQADQRRRTGLLAAAHQGQ